jgi:hypothetical protein
MTGVEGVGFPPNQLTFRFRFHRRKKNTLTMIILHPDHIAFAHKTIDHLCKPHIRLSISQPIRLVKVHLSRVVVEQGPEDRVGETVVVFVG